MGHRVILPVCLSLALFSHCHGADDGRLQRLRDLAELWGRVYLFHPAVAIKGIDYEKALVAAIPAIESARGPDDLAAAINEHLLDSLQDPFTRAYVVPSTKPQRASATKGIEVTAPAPGIRLIGLTNPELYSRSDFLEQLYTAVQQRPDAGGRLVLDLRWKTGIDPSDLVLDWFGLFINERLSPTPRLSRHHEGWAERNDHEFYRQRWQIETGNSIDPVTDENASMRARYKKARFSNIRPVVSPLIVVVNNYSFQVLHGYLDALRASGRTLVVWEKTGPFADDPLSWRDGVQVQLASAALLPRSKASNAPVDLMADVISGEALADLASSDAGVAHTASAAAPFVPAFSFAPAEPQAERPITREERLAALFKVWFVISTLDPNMDLADSDWQDMLPEWVPKVEAANSFSGFYEVMRRLGAKLHDSHVDVVHRGLTAPGWVPGIMLRRVGGRVYVIRTFGEAATSGIRAGDEVIAVAGRPVAAIEADWSTASSHSTPQSLHRRWVQPAATGGPRNTPVVLSIRRSSETLSVPLQRDQPSTAIDPIRPKKPYDRLPGDIGYIQAYYLRNAELNFAMESLADTRGFILDLRGYPRFVGVQNLISKFLSVPGGGRSDWPIAFLTSGGRVVTGSTIRKGVRGPAPGAYRKPLVVLIDSSMVSAAEHIAMSLRNAKRGVLVGNTTKGTNGNITRLFLPGGGWIRFTGMRMKFADGAPFQNIGVVPDVWVDETLGGLIAGDDEILERGLEVLRAKLASE